MEHISPILAATDFSPAAALAAARAARLAGERRCPLQLLHVFNRFGWERLSRLLAESAAADEAQARAEDSLAGLAAELAGHNRPLALSVRTLDGRASTRIAECAQEAGARMIVIGARDEGLGHALTMGGTALKLLRRSPCPVLVVRNAPASPYRHLLLGTDFSATAARALQTALKEFPDAALSVAHAYAVPYEGRLSLGGATPEDIDRYRENERLHAQGNMEAFLAAAGTTRRLRPLLRHGYAASVLIDEVRDSGADLLVVGRHGLSALDEKLLGSVPLNLLHHVPCDVLLVP